MIDKYCFCHNNILRSSPAMSKHLDENKDANCGNTGTNLLLENGQ